MAEPGGAATPWGDRLAIRELIECYADAVIRKDGEAWRSTWSERLAEWHIDGTVVEGIEAIVARWAGRMAEFDGVMFRVSVGMIDVDGDSATARSYTAETFAQRGHPRREVSGRYDDLLRREAGGWRFVRRAFSRLP